MFLFTVQSEVDRQIVIFHELFLTHLANCSFYMESTEFAHECDHNSLDHNLTWTISEFQKAILWFLTRFRPFPCFSTSFSDVKFDQCSNDEKK